MGLANGRDENIGLLDVALNVLGRAVADGDGRISILEEVADWAANDIAPTEDNSLLSLEVHTGRLQKLHDTLWRAWGEEWDTATLGQLTNVDCAEAIDILLVCYGGGNRVLRDVLWDWELDQDTVDGGVVVQDIDLVDELALSGRLGEVNELAADTSLRVIVSMVMRLSAMVGSYLFGGLQLHLNICAGVGAVAHYSHQSQLRFPYRVG